MTHHGLFEFQVMPFGLCNAPGILHRLIEFVLARLQWQTRLVYLENVIIHDQDFDEHLEWLGEVFHQFCLAGLKLKPPKCFLL